MNKLGRQISRTLSQNRLQLLTRVLGTLLASVILPLVIGVILGNKITAIDQFFLGVLTFVSCSIVTIAYDILLLRQQKTHEAEVDFIRDEFDVCLANIRNSYNELIKSRRIKNDLFTEYFGEAIKAFEESIYEAATKHDLFVDENHFSTISLLLATFEGRPSDIIRLVQYMEDLSFMFDIWSRHYYRRLVGMIEDGTVREVRRLFIYTDPSEMEAPDAKRLLDFHARQPGYDYRIISKGDFQKFCRDLRLNENFADFGIYGDRYAYHTISARSDKIEGTFTSSERQVNGYIELFDNLWRHAIVPEPVNEKPMPVYELFEGKPLPPNLQDLPHDETPTRRITGHRLRSI
jgi:hypothetical protein